MRLIDIGGPGFGVRIRSSAELWKQIEIQMIVGVDQARKDQKAAEIERDLVAIHGTVAIRGVFKRDTALANAEVSLLRAVRADSDPGADDPHGRVQQLVKTAGTPLAASNAAPLPARSKIVRSGSPKLASLCQAGRSPAAFAHWF